MMTAFRVECSIVLTSHSFPKRLEYRNHSEWQRARTQHYDTYGPNGKRQAHALAPVDASGCAAALFEDAQPGLLSLRREHREAA